MSGYRAPPIHFYQETRSPRDETDNTHNTDNQLNSHRLFLTVGAASAGPNELKVAHLADAEPSKQSCVVNHLIIGDTSACQDVNFSNPPISPRSQSYLVAADGKQLRPDPAS